LGHGRVDDFLSLLCARNQLLFKATWAEKRHRQYPHFVTTFPMADTATYHLREDRKLCVVDTSDDDDCSWPVGCPTHQPMINGVGASTFLPPSSSCCRPQRRDCVLLLLLLPAPLGEARMDQAQAPQWQQGKQSH
jgi:hypothetical protein